MLPLHSNLLLHLKSLKTILPTSQLPNPTLPPFTSCIDHKPIIPSLCYPLIKPNYPIIPASTQHIFNYLQHRMHSNIKSAYLALTPAGK